MSWALVAEVTDTYDLFPFMSVKFQKSVSRFTTDTSASFTYRLVYEPSERKCKSTDCPFPPWMAHRIKVTAACMVTSV